jgi:GT2 family glycosyltransferase/spore maturation protein CgeB
VLRNERNASFAAACNQGASAARGELLLFLNDDVSPVDPGWLGAMVDAHASGEGLGAVGAHLVYSPDRPDDDVGRPSPLSTQHRGIGFMWADGAVRGINLGVGESPLAPAATAPARVIGCTAACLLVGRSAFEQVGGFTDAYIYGTEDQDFCLKLREAGLDVLYSPGAVLLHEEHGTQGVWTATHRRVKNMRNRQEFLERWGPKLIRSVRLAGIGAEDPAWLSRPPRRAVITLTDAEQTGGFGDWYTAHELGEAMEAQGWSVEYAAQRGDSWYQIDEDVDLVISLLPQVDLDRLPAGPVKVAWVRNWVDRWLANPSFDRYDLALCATRRFAERIDLASSVTTALLPLATNADRFGRGEFELSLAADFTFTGNSWGNQRLVDRIEVKPGEHFTIFGKGWEKFGRAQRYVRGSLDYELMPDVYASTPITIDDTVRPNRPALNARVFDALAAGSLPITDNKEGSAEWFDGKLPVARSRRELRRALDRYLRDDAARLKLVDELRGIVLGKHTYANRAEELPAMAADTVRRPKVALRIGPPSAEVAPRWGDTHFAHDFARALRRLGWATRVDLLPDWDDPIRHDADVVVHLRGLVPSVPVLGAVNALWIISHPDDVTNEEVERFDLVFVASAQYAAKLASRVKVPVMPLLQAAAHERFTPEAEEREHELVFVGNTRGTEREGIDWALAAGLEVEIWGQGWEEVAPDRLVADMLDNRDLPALYASSKVVLCDHWPDMAKEGFISNRVFEAAAAGALPVTDQVAGLAEVFGDSVAVYRTAEELESLISLNLGNSEARMASAAAAREAVLAGHTFDHRAAAFTEVVVPLLGQAPPSPLLDLAVSVAPLAHTIPAAAPTVEPVRLLPRPGRDYLVKYDATRDAVAANRRVTDVPLSGSGLESVAWFLPAFDNPYRGGINTILRFADGFTRRSGTFNYFVIVGADDGIEEMKEGAFGAFPDLKGDFMGMAEGEDPEPLPPAAAGICTLWTTAYTLLRYNQCQLKCYMVQDYEPAFQPAGSVFGLIEQTYRFGFTGICNSPGVGEAYRRYGSPAVDFTPGVDRRFHPGSGHEHADRVRIVFYGRPNYPRNGFELGLQTLQRIKSEFGDAVEILSVGADWEPAAYEVEGVINNLGLLHDLEQVADLYRSADIGISFMFTSHPSYQPLEYMASGLAAVSNLNEANDWLFSDGINCRLVPPVVSAAVEVIAELVEDPAQRHHLGMGGVKTTESLDWEPQIDRIHTALTAGRVPAGP